MLLKIIEKPAMDGSFSCLGRTFQGQKRSCKDFGIPEAHILQYDKSGNKISVLLDNLANDIVDRQTLKKELLTNIKSNSMFILFMIAWIFKQ